MAHNHQVIENLHIEENAAYLNGRQRYFAIIHNNDSTPSPFKEYIGQSFNLISMETKSPHILIGECHLEVENGDIYLYEKAFSIQKMIDDKIDIPALTVGEELHPMYASSIQGVLLGISDLYQKHETCIFDITQESLVVTHGKKGKITRLVGCAETYDNGVCTDANHIEMDIFRIKELIRGHFQGQRQKIPHSFNRFLQIIDVDEFSRFNPMYFEKHPIFMSAYDRMMTAVTSWIKVNSSHNYSFTTFEAECNLINFRNCLSSADHDTNWIYRLRRVGGVLNHIFDKGGAVYNFKAASFMRFYRNAAAHIFDYGIDPETLVSLFEVVWPYFQIHVHRVIYELEPP